MASITMNAKAYLRTPADVRAESPLRQYVDELTQLDYTLIDHDEELGRLVDIMRAMNPGEAHLPPGPSPTLNAAITALITGKRVGQELRSDLFFPGSELYIGAFATQVLPVFGHLFFSLTLAPENGYIVLQSESKTFGDDLVHPRWMTLVQALYDTWHPVYLFPEYHVGETTNKRSDILAGKVSYLHTEYNYFGPDLSAQLGRERLLQTPAVRVAELRDGGVFIGQGNTEQAAAYLGLTKSPAF